MQEVFEKIIEKLEEHKSKIAETQEGTFYQLGFNVAIEIVNQVAEEYRKEAIERFDPFKLIRNELSKLSFERKSNVRADSQMVIATEDALEIFNVLAERRFAGENIEQNPMQSSPWKEHVMGRFMKGE